MSNTPESYNYLTNFARVDIKVQELDRMIHQKGVNAVWQRSMLCSCVNTETGQPDFTCPACFGKGYYYFNPTELRVAVTQLASERNQMPVGLLDVGTAMMTVKSTDLGVNFRDRLTFPDFRITYSQILTYSATDVNGQRLKYECESVLQVQQLSISIPDTAYTISEDKQFIQLAPNTVDEGANYSILYEIKPVYIVINTPHELRGTFVKFGNAEETWTLLPKQYQIKREDLMPLRRGTVG